MIWLFEYMKDGNSMYDVNSFFIDKTHMKKCLGLEKGTDSIYSNVSYLEIDKSRSRYYKDIIKAFAEAYDNITIKVTTNFKKGELPILK